ncbi:MAG: LuxR family transcriptional regulator [Fimbriimonadaceae bacterium]|nr:LuxR family transcriptional regulator [Alphaproteobacteria bacterium]
MDHVFQTFVDSLHGNADIPTLGSAMAEVAGAFDLSAFAYLYAGRQPNAEVKLISNYPKAWTTRYLAKQYDQIDPVVNRVGQTCEPFRWGREYWYGELRDSQIQLLEEAAHFGIRFGLTIPIHDPVSRIAAVTFAADNGHVKFTRCVERHRPLLQLLAILFHSRARLTLAPERSVSGIMLSPREHECLEWAAKGKSAWDIGCILNISRRTAAFHLDNAKSKLGVRTISQAVALLATSMQSRL